jgi:uncharacterized SAM-binding protein YcdF (DUF218 family)
MLPLALRNNPGLAQRLPLSLASVLTGGFFGLHWAVDRFGQREGAVEAEAVVVLGARVLPGGVPSGALQARLEKAVALYHQGLAPRLVLSGGVGLHPPSEARVMCELAMRLGVPEEACLLEEQSRSTEENARFSTALLRGLGARRVVLVSDPFHLLRARQYFRLHGFEVATSPASLEGRDLPAFDRFYWTAREAVALLSSPRLLLARRPPVPRGT